MFIRPTKRLLSSLVLGAGLVAMSLTTPMTDSAHAAPTQPTVSQDQSSCESRGFMWDGTTKKCADKPCRSGGQPGDTRIVRTKGGSTDYFYCNGFSGQWEILR